MRPLTALVVDDHEDFRRFLRTTLQEHLQCQIQEQLQYQIKEASDGMEAIVIAEQFQPDLILLDLGLPKLNGMEVAQRLRNSSPKSKILIVSQESSPEIVSKALRLGAHGYLLKSDAMELVGAVAAVLQGDKFLSSRLKIGRATLEEVR